MMNAPRGFRPIPRLSPFNALVGPLHERKKRGQELSIGLRIEEKHLNSRGICHGGVLATLADLALGNGPEDHVPEDERHEIAAPQPRLAERARHAERRLPDLGVRRPPLETAGNEAIARVAARRLTQRLG